MPESKLLLLNFVLRAQGSHSGGWRHTHAEARDVVSLDYYVGLAEVAERGLFDTIFLTDTLALSDDPAEALQWPLDPATVIAAIAARTSRIGLIATHSTTFNEPFNTARTFRSIDHLSDGRAGWNVVTSTSNNGARNFGIDEIPEHDGRYARAAEYLEAALALWHSWDTDAVVGDKAAGRLVDRSKVYQVNFEGEHFRVRGPLHSPSSPQVVPLLSQAGTSEPGRDLAARYADLVYVYHSELGDARAYRADIRRRAAAFGRNPDHVKVLPGLIPYIGATRAEAQELVETLFDLDDPAGSLARFGEAVGIDFDRGDLGRAVPWDKIEENRDRWAGRRPAAGAVAKIVAAYSGEDLTLRALLSRGDLRFQHRALIGTAADIADYIVEGYETGAFDGVSIIPAELPGGLTAFVDQVVPLLQERGVYKTEYGAGTLRERFGSPAPTASRAGWVPTAG